MKTESDAFGFLPLDNRILATLLQNWQNQG
jgi:hypothetical protein